MPSKKPRIRPYLDEPVYVRLKAASTLNGVTESDIVNEALKAHFAQEHEDTRTGAMVRRLDRITRQLEVLKRNQIIQSEAFALYVRYFLTVIPPVNESDKKAAQAKGHKRFTTYLESLRTVLEDGDPILMTALEDVMVDDSAFFTQEELQRLHEPTPKRQEAVHA